MPPDGMRKDHAYLWDMLQHSRTLIRIADGRSRDELDSSIEFRYAIERLIEIVGEACRKVSTSTREAHPEIPWSGIQAQRHVLAHEYGRIDYDKIWSVVTIHAPSLIEKLEPIVPEPPEDPLPEQ